MFMLLYFDCPPHVEKHTPRPPTFDYGEKLVSNRYYMIQREVLVFIHVYRTSGIIFGVVFIFYVQIFNIFCAQIILHLHRDLRV